jgi:uncharacterized DUF497 family protein
VEIVACTWSEEIASSLQRKHNIDRDEVESLISGNPKFRFVEKGYRPDGDVYAALGQTEAGRYLIVFFSHIQEGHARILCARDMKRAERQKYEQA